MTIEFYTGDDGQIYWRLRAKNHRIIGIGGQGYSRMIDARRGCTLATGFRTTGYAAYRAKVRGGLSDSPREWADVRDLRRQS